MAERALIIAIQRYDQATEGFTAKELNGTLDAAKRFREWLEEKWKVEKVKGTVLFCSEPKVADGRGATHDDIVDAVKELERQGRNQTDILYVYFSGHGFRLANETIHLADVLVAANFRDRDRAATSCIKLNALINVIRTRLGTGCHFYFIDACRNEVPEAVASDFMSLGQADGDPSVFVLQSTVPGSPALVGGPFARKLLEGLRGAGTAKVWQPPATDCMKVRFDSLRKFLKDGLQKTQPIAQNTSGEKGESEAVLATIKPVPLIKLSITLKTKRSQVEGQVLVTPYGTAVSTPYPITERTLVIELPPNYYKIVADLGPLPVSPREGTEAELYESREVTFEVADEVIAEGPRPAKPVLVPKEGQQLETTLFAAANVRVNVPGGAEVVMRHMATGEESIFKATGEASVLEGDYATILRKADGSVLQRGETSLKANTETELTPGTWRGSPPHESIARRFPVFQGGVEFSEALGPAIVDGDLSIWLSILGAGRVLSNRTGDYSKIGPLPLHDFSGELPGASPIYVLAGLSEPNLDVQVSLSGGEPNPQWQRARQPNGMVGLSEVVMHPPTGQWFVSLAIGTQPTYTLASFASPNRCTLITLTLDEDGQPRVGQYLLPLGHLVENLDPEILANINLRYAEWDPPRRPTALSDVYVLSLLSRAFRKRRKIEAEFKNNELEELLYSKWIDPIGASLATYECLRRNRKDPLKIVAMNMQRYFADLPDTSAIARLSGKAQTAHRGVPLFLDGLRAFRDYGRWLPYPAGLLDFSGPWTAWRGALKNPTVLSEPPRAPKQNVLRTSGAKTKRSGRGKTRTNHRR